jgi:ABC-type branched-subunit amino acid transport system substrate-binding protein
MAETAGLLREANPLQVREPANAPPAALMGCGLLLLLVGLASAACGPLALSRPVTKLGLVAPFEGTQRARGYEALYAAKLALREHNASGGAAGWQVELVALDQDDQPGLALRQAHALAVDPGVTYVIGLTTAAQTGQLQRQYDALGLPVEFVELSATEGPPLDPIFAEHYRALSNGIEPGGLALRVYAATQTAVAHIADRVRALGHPTR